MRGVKTRDKNSKWKQLATFLVLLLVFGVLLNSARKVYNKKEDAEKALVRMNEEMKELEDRQDFLKNSLQRLTTEEGVKFEIKKKLNVAEVGESVAIIVDEGEPTTTPPATVSSWQKLKNFFTDLFE